MRSLFVACGIGLAVGVCVGVGSAGSSLNHARELIRLKQYDRAKGELAPAVESFQGVELDEALLALAGVETNPERAVALYERVAASGSPDASHRAELELAKISYARGDYARALDILQSNDKRSTPADPASCYLRGLCYRQLGDPAHARAEFIKVDRDEYLSWSLIALADIDREEGRVEQAVERYAAIGRTFASPIASFKLGECYELLGDRAKSIEAYRSIASNFPRSFEASQAKEKILRLSQAKAERKEAIPPRGGEEGTAIGKGAGGETSPHAIYTIQFGAFGTKDNADRVAKRIASVVAEVRVETVDTGDRILYRVRAGRYSNRETAEQDAARAREKLGLPCTIVPLR